MRILECLMRDSPITISRDTLIERTWGYDFAVEGNRVDVSILRLRKKLERDPRSSRRSAVSDTCSAADRRASVRVRESWDAGP